MPLSDADRFGTDIDLPLTDGDTLLITPTGDLRTRTGRANLQDALTQRALTGRGELLHRPEYGGGLPQGVELPNSPSARSQLASVVRRNCLRDRRVQDATVSVAPGLPDDATRLEAVTLSIVYKTSQDEAETLSVGLTE